MQNDKAGIMADQLIDSLAECMKKGAKDFQTRNINEDVNNKTFVVEFVAYNYYWVGIEYEKGRITPYIIEGNRIIRLKELMNWWEELDLSKWIYQVDFEIRLRIPDKYLEAKGWK